MSDPEVRGASSEITLTARLNQIWNPRLTLTARLNNIDSTRTHVLRGTLGR